MDNSVQPQPIAPTVPPQSVVAPAPMKKSPLPILVGSSIIILLSVSGLLAYQNWNLQKQIAALQVSSSIAPTPTPAADPTANWKTYTSDYWGISFKHPELDDKCCGLGGAVTGNPVVLITLADSSTVIPNTDSPFDGIALYGIPNNENLTLDQYVEKEKAVFLSDFKSMADPGQINQGVTTKTSIDGLPAIVLSNYARDGITRTYLKSNKNSFIFEISKKEKSPNHFTSYDQILSTFKFQ